MNTYCLMNHEPTAKQLYELKTEFGSEHVKFPIDRIQKIWAHIPTDRKFNKKLLYEVIKWIDSIEKGSVIIIQGEAGVSFALVLHARQRGLIPVHSVTERIARETRNGEQITREYLFEHICFRKYTSFEEMEE